MAYLKHTASADILFPDEDATVADESFYSPPSNSTYSTYSHEVKYIFDPQYAKRQNDFRHDTVQYDPDAYHRYPYYGGSTRELSRQDIYSPPQNHFKGYLPPPGVYRTPNYPEPYASPAKSYNTASRRRTWSPPTFNRMMGSGSSFHAMRSYHSNDQLDVDTGNYYEDLDSAAPPKIQPVSGTLNKNAHKSLIKPIAFKPILPPHSRYVSTPHRHHQQPVPSPRHPTYDTMTMRSANHSQDDGYVSQEYATTNHSHSNSNTSQGSVNPDHDRSVTYANERHRHPSHDRPPSYTSSNHSRISANHMESYLTPSPSDSGVGEIENLIREKDAEIQQLRETMEKNETAIFQVFEEKKQNWEVEMKDFNAGWERRLRQQQQKAFKMEQALLMQLFKLQQERKALRQDVDKERSDKEHAQKQCACAEKETTQLKAKVEELEWEICQKSGEISLLKSQIKGAKDESGNKLNDLVKLKSQLRDSQEGSDGKDRRISDLESDLQSIKTELDRCMSELDLTRRDLDSSRSELTRLRERKSSGEAGASKDSPDLTEEVTKLREKVDWCQRNFLQEKEQWLQEKNKVIRYQKHLQLNYIQMFKRNKMLESEVEQLTLELENRDISLINGERSDEGEVSMC